jgi:membrane dipeptidase
VAFDGYVKIKPADSPERAAALAALRKTLPAGGMATMTDEQRAAFRAGMAEINKKHPQPRATVADFVNHVDYLVKKLGIDHVGISSDFDGGGGVDGWSNAEETKLWSGNLLRVMDEVQQVAAKLQAAAK